MPVALPNAGVPLQLQREPDKCHQPDGPLACEVENQGACACRHYYTSIDPFISYLTVPGDESQDDIIDEALGLYRANTFFKNFDIKGAADRVLIYLTLYIQECLSKLSKLPSQVEGARLLQTHAVMAFALPGDANFPLNAMYEKPKREEVETLRAYLTQLRQECSARLVARIYEDDKPSKWWMCFSKRKFMGMNNIGTSN